jgi:hypothetical protein
MSVGGGGQQGPFAQHVLQHEYVRFAASSGSAGPC